jgi:chromosome segregation ATPase
MNRSQERFNALQVSINELMSDHKIAIDAMDSTNKAFVKILNERDEIQGRLQAIDHAYAISQQANKVAGEEIRRLKDENKEMARKLDAALFINNHMKGVQRTIGDLLTADGIRARTAIERIRPMVANSYLVEKQLILISDKIQ